jgi:putative ABC transport system permease protein
MSADLLERAGVARRDNGGAPARRALVRWSWRLFRREWRQQLLVLALLTVAVAGTTFGVALAANAEPAYNPAFGTANYALTWRGSDPNLAADIAAAARHFGLIEVIEQQRVKIPGSVNTVELRAQNPRGRYSYPILGLDAGHYPAGRDQVAVTAGVAAIYRLHIGSPWRAAGHLRRVVGIIENPQNLLDNFALVAPGQATPPQSVTVLLDTTQAQINAFQPPGGRAGLPAVAARPPVQGGFPAVAVLVFTSVGLLFVGLVAIAGFAVVAGRRLRAVGMLGAIGATGRHIRLVMVTNGLIVGAVAALAGLVLGAAGWLAALPRIETLAEHRINSLSVPWLDIAAGMLLAVVTAVAAAWWPARAAARMPVTAALSRRPPRPQPGYRFAFLGCPLLAAGLGLLLLAHHRSQTSNHASPPFTVAGLVLTAVGVLLLAPLAIRILAAVGQRAPIATRLALRDLVRYQARSGAALAAIALSLGISAAIAISAAAASATASIPPGGGNLPPNELIVYLTSAESPTGTNSGTVPVRSAAALHADGSSVDSLATSLHAGTPLGLDVAIAPTAADLSPAQGGPGKQTTALLGYFRDALGGGRIYTGYASTGNLLYVATPEVLRYYGIDPSSVGTADVLTSSQHLTGYLIGDFAHAPCQIPAGQTGCRVSHRNGHGLPQPPGIAHPVIDRVAALPRYTSAPTTLITMRAVHQLKLDVVPAAWLLSTARPLTEAQIVSADHWAARSGLTIETRTQPAKQNLSTVATEATLIGLLVALGVLVMTTGLIRAETANDLRTLTAAGSSSGTRRMLTAATAGSLALLGALLGVAGCYLALIAWDKGVSSLTHVPYVDLAITVFGLPALAAAGGWLLAGREPTGIARQALD